MDLQVSRTSSTFLQTITAGIQVLAALIPLLTTRLCEGQVTIALQKGFLRAAAAPMTTFGILGIAKVGIVALCGDIDCRLFSGSALLKDAGINPTGLGELLLRVKGEKHNLYQAEDRLRTILSKKKVRKVAVEFPWNFWWWNIKLAFSTAALSGLGVIPYVHPIYMYLSDRPFHETWMFPLLRVLGCVLVVVGVQFLFQLRIIEETYCRLRFDSADYYLKRKGKSVPSHWDPNKRSKEVLTAYDLGTDLEDERDKVLNGIHKLKSFSFCPLQDEDRQKREIPAHPVPVAPNPPTLHKRHQPRSSTVDMELVEQGTTPEPHGVPLPGINCVETASPTTPTKTLTLKAGAMVNKLARPKTTTSLWVLQLALLCGVLLTFTGCIGSFGVVRAAHDASAQERPFVWLVWLMCELGLACLRAVILAANPCWDNSDFPFVLEKLTVDDMHGCKLSSSYGIGWALDSPTVDDIHALVIGISEYSSGDFGDLPTAKSDAQSFESYLKETLLVPRSQIRTLYDSEATRCRIVDQLQSLRYRGSVATDAPIIIYFALHSFVSDEDGNAYVVPYHPNEDRKTSERRAEDYSLRHSIIVDLLRDVGDEKTDNTVVILDSCHAGLMGVGSLDSGPGSANSSDLSRRPSKSKSSAQSSIVGGAPETQRDPTDTSLFQAPQILEESRPLATLTRQSSLSKVAEEISTAGASRLTAVRPQAIGHRKSFQSITQETAEILIGHSSHILLAGTAANQQAYECPVTGGQFTQTLLAVLKDAETSGELQSMTYRMLIDQIRERFEKSPIPEEHTPGKRERMISEIQTPLCTTMYQNRLLFGGLFKRRVDNRGAKPVLRVVYSDYK